MKKLNTSLNEIQNIMRFNCGKYWVNYLSTNCYAYALGIDIPENEIIKNAYQPGTIGSVIFNININNMTLEEKIFLDLDSLNISYKECYSNDKSSYKPINDLILYEWVIALFIGRDKDFHFMRKSWSNLWWHKFGYNLSPINYDDDFKIIKNPEECKLYDYKYVKCLKLGMTRKY